MLPTTIPAIHQVLQDLYGKRCELNLLITALERYAGIKPDDAAASDPLLTPNPPPARDAKPRPPKTEAARKPAKPSGPEAETLMDAIREIVRSGKGLPAEFTNQQMAEALSARGRDIPSNTLAAAICNLTTQGFLQVAQKQGMQVTRRLHPKWAMQAQIRAEIDAKHAQSD